MRRRDGKIDSRQAARPARWVVAYAVAAFGLAGNALAYVVADGPATTPSSCDRSAAAVKAPAMWRATRGEAQWFLFGSMHVLPPNLDWQNGCFKDVIARSDVIWLEAPTTPAWIGISRYNSVIELLHRRDDTVSDVLSDPELTLLRTIAEAVNVDYEWIISKPLWHADAILTGSLLRRKHYYSRHGVEWILENQARRRDKRLQYLESGAQQRMIMNSLRVEVQHDSLMQTLNQIANGNDSLERLTDAWLSGDLGTLFMTIHDNTHPEMYQRLILDRNRDWVARIEREVAKGLRRALLVVGAGHLSGPHSLVHMLRQKGFAVQRVQ